jgi:hypothetical protein
MSYEFSEKVFEIWLIENRNLSKKSAGDVVSRLNRCRAHVDVKSFSDLESCEEELKKNLANSSIPDSSQKSMFRALNLYFQFRN